MLVAAEIRQPKSRTLVFPAPSGGWVQSGNEIAPGKDQAEQLDNFIPTAQGARLRGGTTELDDAGAAVVRLFTYRSATENFFAATASDIYDATNVAGGSLRGSLTSGDWSTCQISTAGGQFLVGVNGADVGWTYNGASFSNISLTGVTSSDLSQVWLFKSRLFFIEEGTTSVWYLPVESIGGTVSEIDLGSKMTRGGSLLFGATWSLDSGSGLDDVCVFVTDQGEILVYEGTDPASASTWSLVGVYSVGKPLNKHAWFKAGGDLAILTEDGIIAVSEALRKDRAALQGVALTYPIEDAWKEAIQQRTASYPISATLWQSGTLLLVGTPAKYRNRRVSFVANARTGKWARFTGWDVRCAAIYNDELYFADSTGKILKADTGGTDNGTGYTGVWVPKFQTSVDMGDVNSVGVTYRAPEAVEMEYDAHSDYEVDEIKEPATVSFNEGDVWGTGVWGTFVWGSTTALDTFTDWQAAYTSGYSFSPSVAVTSNQTTRLPLELLVARVRVEMGSVI